MCGLVGLVLRPGEAVDRERLLAMRDAMAHRGPDAVGELVDGPVGLGHRRLSIIDTSALANQPLYNEDGEVGVIFNGEIYNFRELVDELVARGHELRSQADTDVLVHGWEEWGSELVGRLNGMFTFAIYDRRQRVVFVARDRYGQKPLHWTLTDDGLAFASEIKGLLADPRVSRELDPTALAESMVWGHTSGERTAYAAVRRLLPGHTMTVDLDRPSAPVIERYWAFEPCPDPGLDLAAWRDELVATLWDATRLRMISDVPLGAFLSGGIDSSLIVAAMRHADDDVHTFSIGFHEAAWDESGHARAVAEHLGTDHRDEMVTPSALEVLPHLVRAYDEPFGDASAIPTWYLSRMTRRHVTVALSGDAGDELFFGYERYRETRLLQRAGLLATPLGRAVAGRAARLLPRGSWTSRALDRVSYRGAAQYLHAHGFAPVYLSLLRPELRDALGEASAHRLAREFDRYPQLDFVDRCRFTDFAGYLPDDILVKVDRASMAHSLEVRSPFLDPRIAELAARLPGRAQMNGRELKTELRRLAYTVVPRPLLERPKQGFAVPLRDWFRGELRSSIEEAVADEANPIWRYYDRGEADRRLEHHLSGRLDASHALWRLLFAATWARDAI